MALRQLQQLYAGRAASDGAGVKLTRVFGPESAASLDPFLLLDEFGSDEANDYIAGFPSHPHRGFETVTYMLHGQMEHQDHLGNIGRLNSGDVQWMTAARGIVHSEMPKQESGLMKGFQLWINLPAAEKMNDPGYQDIAAENIPQYALGEGVKLKLVAGELTIDQQQLEGAVRGISTQPLYADIHMPAGSRVTVPVTPGHTAMFYVYQGEVKESRTAKAVKPQQLALLSDGDGVGIVAVEESKLMLLAARPLREPVVHYGPFVMNTREEINQALMDYRDGKLTE